MIALRILGKFLISVGVGVLFFLAWSLLGTGLYTQQQQQDLERQYDLLPSGDVAGASEKQKLGPANLPGPGAPVFRLRIPEIGFNYLVVEGVGVEDLKKGPGHYPSCRPGFERPLCTEFDEVWPGQEGRVIVSGHRTTYGRDPTVPQGPFFHLDRLEPGDEIITETKWGDFTYEVTETRIVQPDSLAIAITSDAAEIVLTTCNPKYSAAQRLIVFGRLVTT
jgi:sortase A